MKRIKFEIEVLGKEIVSAFHWLGSLGWDISKLLCPGMEGDRAVSTYSLVPNRSYAATIIVCKGCTCACD